MGRGRPRQFDKQSALHKAMLVFWRNGYRGTSIDDLTQALEINRPSLYAAFGDKESLFLESIDFYRNTHILPIARHLEAENLHQGLTAFFRSFARLVVNEETPPGCLIACVLSEECCDSLVIREKLAQLIAGADRAFCVAFERHQEHLRSPFTPQSAACLFTSVVHGLAIRARSGASLSEIEAVGRTIVSILANG